MFSFVYTFPGSLQRKVGQEEGSNHQRTEEGGGGEEEEGGDRERKSGQGERECRSSSHRRCPQVCSLLI